MPPPRIYVTRALPGDTLAALRGRYDIGVWPEDRAIDRDRLLAEAAAADGLVVMLTDAIDEALLKRAAERLRVVSVFAVGYDNVDVAAATRRGIAICHTPGIPTETTADLAFALILAVARRVVESDRYVREGQWRGWAPEQLLGRDVHGATLGIVGMGAIGEAVARRAIGFGMHLLYHDQRPRPGDDQLDARFTTLDDLLRQSDFVSIHAPLSDATRGLLGARELALMPPHAILVNTARGPIIDQRALFAALRDGRIAGAGLDVFDPEPIAASDPLLTLPNVVVMPHLGSATIATRTRAAALAIENAVAAIEGRRPPACLNWDDVAHRQV